MLTEYEARKLQADMRRELEGSPAALWKCAAGLVVVIVMVIVGAVDTTGGPMAGTASAVASVGHAAR
ncbi:MAG TPA: hypothetical protein VGP15_13065 [Burkholderiales bacterium]|jgi:hypothetical protein|nr:hypothetical protein [Burkholderiales bacterium]